VIGVSAGTVGCYGGMSIAAGLCSYMVLTSEARLGLNGPQVIEQEAGVAEFDSRNRPLIWSLTGGEQRYQSGLADLCVADDTVVMRSTVAELFRRGVPEQHRSARYADFIASLAQVDVSVPATAQQVRAIYAKGVQP
jgi:malonate decarboxylase beta subunit